MLKILIDVPDLIPEEAYLTHLPIKREAPFNTLLTKEIQRYNLLLSRIVRSLEETQATIEGHRNHDETTEDIFECLQTERTPQEWRKFSYPCHLEIYPYI